MSHMHRHHGLMLYETIRSAPYSVSCNLSLWPVFRELSYLQPETHLSFRAYRIYEIFSRIFTRFIRTIARYELQSETLLPAPLPIDCHVQLGFLSCMNSFSITSSIERFELNELISISCIELYPMNSIQWTLFSEQDSYRIKYMIEIWFKLSLLDSVFRNRPHSTPSPDAIKSLPCISRNQSQSNQFTKLSELHSVNRIQWTLLILL